MNKWFSLNLNNDFSVDHKINPIGKPSGDQKRIFAVKVKVMIFEFKLKSVAILSFSAIPSKLSMDRKNIPTSVYDNSCSMILFLIVHIFPIIK